MASQETYKAVDIEDVVKNALEEFRNNQLIDDDDISEVMKEATKTETELTTKMFHMTDTTPMWEVEREMLQIIGPERVELIRESFIIETYEMKVLEKPDGQSSVLVQRDGNEFLPEIMLKTNNDIETAIVLQWASVVVDLFLFVFRCVGIDVDLNASEMKDIVQEVEGFVRDSAFQGALNKFLEAWNKARDVWEAAKTIFFILKDIHSLGFLWKIIKLIIKKMCLCKKIKPMALVASLIIAAFKTKGKALIARIAFALKHSVNLAEKIGNIITFSNMKKTMK